MEPVVKIRDTIAKTHAKAIYCLSDKDLQQLTPSEKKNPMSKFLAPMKLYKKSELEELAVTKFGSMEAVTAEREKRDDKRASRAEAKGVALSAAAAADAADDAADADADANADATTSLGAGAATHGGEGGQAAAADGHTAPGRASFLSLPWWLLERVRVVLRGGGQDATPPSAAGPAAAGSGAAATSEAADATHTLPQGAAREQGRGGEGGDHTPDTSSAPAAAAVGPAAAAASTAALATAACAVDLTADSDDNDVPLLEAVPDPPPHAGTLPAAESGGVHTVSAVCAPGSSSAEAAGPSRRRSAREASAVASAALAAPPPKRVRGTRGGGASVKSASAAGQELGTVQGLLQRHELQQQQQHHQPPQQQTRQAQDLSGPPPVVVRSEQLGHQPQQSEQQGSQQRHSQQQQQQTQQHLQQQQQTQHSQQTQTQTQQPATKQRRPTPAAAKADLIQALRRPQRLHLPSPAPPPPSCTAAAASARAGPPAPSARAGGAPAARVLSAEAVNGGAADQRGRECVLYWMKTAVRGHENPALDVAKAAAAALGLPLVVAAFLLRSHTHANDRRYKFLLEGLRDAQRELQQQGLCLHVFLEGHTYAAQGACAEQQQRQQQQRQQRQQRQQQQQQQSLPPSTGWQALTGLADRAAVVVTEDMPVDPDQGWLDKLSGQLDPGTALWAVDTSCIVPMRLVGKGHERAGGYRAATSGLRDARMRLYSHGGTATSTAAAANTPAAAPSSQAGAPAPASPTPTPVPANSISRFFITSPGATPPAPAASFPAAAAAAAPTASTAAAPTATSPAAAAAAAAEARASTSQASTVTTATTAAAATATADVARLRSETAGVAAAVVPHSDPGAAGPGPRSGAGPAAAAGVSLGWVGLDLQAAGLDLAALLAGCEGLDHTVPGVQHTVGGSVSGYGRWADFKKRGLSLYAATRNDAMNRNGVSRMSPYHHWGERAWCPPFRIAREAAAHPGGGKAKYVDEFLIWREVAHAFCFYRYSDLGRLASLPKWAVDTMEAHRGDPRELRLPYDIEMARTGDRMWDAAQWQLITTGELHNNVRMTWGKAPLHWLPAPLQALTLTQHLNDKYALDGCDPSSYGGVLWCYGQFDGPKAATGTRVSGSLRQRPTGTHGKRLDLPAYRDLAA
ncbi:MAG: hypothetical protein WDW36_009186 [Sanguina aurantia]